MRRFIMFLIRRRLGLKRLEGFRFANQKSKTDFYFFGQKHLWKVEVAANGKVHESHVSLNYILSNECHIVKI